MDTTTGELVALVDEGEWNARTVVHPDLTRKTENMGRELFAAFRQHVSTAETGAVSVFGAPAIDPAARTGAPDDEPGVPPARPSPELTA